MGSTQSTISSEAAVAALVAAGAIAYGYLHYSGESHPNTPAQTSSAAPSASTKKGKKKKHQSDAPSHQDAPAQPVVVSFPDVVPGGFEAPETSAQPAGVKPKKKKKATKKTLAPAATSDALSESSATAPESSVRPASSKPKKSPQPPQLKSPGGAADEPWTRVEPRRRGAPQEARKGEAVGASVPLSDAGVTTSVTGNSSPVTERTEDELSISISESVGGDNQTRRTLAEKLLPKPRKTGVEDMLETSDYPQVARVMRVQPRPDEKPAQGFTWGDYEDVDDSRVVTADDADGEDDGGWGVVKSKTRSRANPGTVSTTQPQKASEQTKKQRQNAAKRDAQKKAKEAAEVERQALLAKHRRELERAKTSTASVENGHLVWN